MFAREEVNQPGLNATARAARILNESRVWLKDLVRELPGHRAGRPRHYSAALRWVLRGIRLRNGERVRLEAVKIGAGWLTSREAFARFLAAQTPTNQLRPAAGGTDSVNRRDQIDFELGRLGLTEATRRPSG
jgi:hypothetical protein